jgi:dTDP-4-amino-4,6-dideoxygalactose transaminase
MGRGSFPVAEKACDTLFSIPLGPSLSEDQLEHVVETLTRIGSQA